MEQGKSNEECWMKEPVIWRRREVGVCEREPREIQVQNGKGKQMPLRSFIEITAAAGRLGTFA